MDLSDGHWENIELTQGPQRQARNESDQNQDHPRPSGDTSDPSQTNGAQQAAETPASRVDGAQSRNQAANQTAEDSNGRNQTDGAGDPAAPRPGQNDEGPPTTTAANQAPGNTNQTRGTAIGQAAETHPDQTAPANSTTPSTNQVAGDNSDPIATQYAPLIQRLVGEYLQDPDGRLLVPPPMRLMTRILAWQPTLDDPVLVARIAELAIHRWWARNPNDLTIRHRETIFTVGPPTLLQRAREALHRHRRGDRPSGVVGHGDRTAQVDRSQGDCRLW